MKQYSKEYLEFELKHTKELVELHHNTRDEELRLQILEVRKTLERIFLMGSKLGSTGVKVKVEFTG